MIKIISHWWWHISSAFHILNQHSALLQCRPQLRPRVRVRVNQSNPQKCNVKHTHLHILSDFKSMPEKSSSICFGAMGLSPFKASRQNFYYFYFKEIFFYKSLTRIFPSSTEMTSPIILTRSSYWYVLSVSHTASRIVRISLLMYLENK